MSGMQKCPECPWIGYGLEIHIGIRHRSYKKRKEISDKIQRIARVLEQAEEAPLGEISKLMDVLADLAERTRKKRQKEIELAEYNYDHIREKILSVKGGVK